MLGRAPHEFGARHPSNALASSCVVCGRPREHALHDTSGELDIPSTLAELRRDLLDIRAGFPTGTRQHFALTIAYGALEPNEET